MINLSIFVDRLKEFMEEEKLNETTLANKINFSRVTISNIINKTHTPSTKLLLALVNHFNCSADYLLGREEIPREIKFQSAKPFGNILRKCLKDCGKSETALINDLNISSSLTYRWLHNKAKPNVVSLDKLADYFGCTVDYLLGLEV